MNLINRIFLLILLLFVGCGIAKYNLQENAANLLIGKWVLTTDENFMMDIKRDSICYHYNGHLDLSNPVMIVFGDSLHYYYNPRDNSFNFIKKGKLKSQIKLNEIDSETGETIVSKIIYIDAKGLDIISRNRSVSYRKVKR